MLLAPRAPRECLDEIRTCQFLFSPAERQCQFFGIMRKRQHGRGQMVSRSQRIYAAYRAVDGEKFFKCISVLPVSRQKSANSDWVQYRQYISFIYPSGCIGSKATNSGVQAVSLWAEYLHQPFVSGIYSTKSDNLQSNASHNLIRVSILTVATLSPRYNLLMELRLTPEILIKSVISSILLSAILWRIRHFSIRCVFTFSLIFILSLRLIVHNEKATSGLDKNR
jgi:hypothetical protein